MRDLLLLEGVLADGEDEGLAGTSHDDGVLKEDHVRVDSLVLLGVAIGALLHSVVRSWHIRVDLLLVDMHIHFLDQDAVSGDAIALVEEDDVANNDILRVDSLGGAVLATKYDNLLILNLVLQAQELLLFTPVTEGLDHGGKEDGEVDGDRFEPLLAVDTFLLFGEDAHEQRDGGEDQEDLDVPLVELVPQDLPEGADGWQGLFVLSEAKLNTRED